MAACADMAAKALLLILAFETIADQLLRPIEGATDPYSPREECTREALRTFVIHTLRNCSSRSCCGVSTSPGKRGVGLRQKACSLTPYCAMHL